MTDMLRRLEYQRKLNQYLPKYKRRTTSIKLAENSEAAKRNQAFCVSSLRREMGAIHIEEKDARILRKKSRINLEHLDNSIHGPVTCTMFRGSLTPDDFLDPYERAELERRKEAEKIRRNMAQKMTLKEQQPTEVERTCVTQDGGVRIKAAKGENTCSEQSKIVERPKSQTNYGTGPRMKGSETTDGNSADNSDPRQTKHVTVRFPSASLKTRKLSSGYRNGSIADTVDHRTSSRNNELSDERVHWWERETNRKGPRQARSMRELREAYTKPKR